MKRLLFLLLMLGSVLFAEAQLNFVEGHIITNDNVTLHGKIKSTTPGQRSTQIVFIENGEKEKLKYKPFQIKGYHVDGMTYESKIYDFDPALPYGYAVFMERINKGTVKIYYYWNTDKERGFTQTFLENDGDYLVEVNPLTFKRQMVQYFEEYPRLQSKIKRGDYKKKQLEEIVQEFNDWKEESW